MLGRGGILLCPRGFPAVTVRLKLRDGAAKSPCTCGLDSEIYTACGGGGGDALKGTWEQEGTDYGTVTWKFDGKGGFTSESDFFDNKGTYTIDGSQVTITRDGDFADPVVYDFAVSGSSLTLTATDGLAPDYDLTKK